MGINNKSIKIILNVLIIFRVITISQAISSGGDGKIIYGNVTAPANQPKTRDFSVGGSWGAVNSLPAAETVINRVIVKVSPQDDEYVAGVLTSANTRLTVYTYSGGSWTLSWFDNAPPSALFGNFDIEYEQDSGDCLVVYSNGGTTNELSYRKRVDGVWDISSSTLESNRTTNRVEWVVMEARPGIDEIALAFSDANDDLNAFIWDGSAWTAEPAVLLSGTLVNTNTKKFDIAYEQSSGDVLLVYSINGTAGVGAATKAAGSTVWNNTADDGVFRDVSNIIDLGSEPGTDYIAFGSYATGTNDTQVGIWNGSGGISLFNNADTGGGAAAYYEAVACGWAGTGAGRRAVVVYTDAAALNLSYFTWLKSSASWEQAANNPARTPNYFVSGVKRHLKVNHDPNFATNGLMWLSAIDSNSDLWVLNYDGVTGASNWTVIDDGTAGDNPIENSLSNAAYPCAGIAFTNFDPTLVELIAFQAVSRDRQAVITWKTASELRTRGFKIYRTFSPDNPNSYEEITQKIIPAFGNPFSGREYQYIDENPPLNICYILEEVMKDGRVKRLASARLDDGTNFPEQTSPESPENKKPVLSRSKKPDFKGKALTSASKEKDYVKMKMRKHNYESFNPLKIEVEEEGIYRITAQDLIDCGWDIDKINPRRVSMSSRGKTVPIHIFGEKDKKLDETDYIEFYGKPNLTRYTPVNIYWLRLDQPDVLGIKPLNLNYSEPVAADYIETVRCEENISYYPEFKGGEHWFFEEEFISPACFDFKINLDRIVYAGDEAVLRVNFMGGSGWGFGAGYNRQKAVIYLNDNLIGEAGWVNDEAFTFNEKISVNLLLEGENKLTIKSPDEGGRLSQIFLLNWFEIIYPRELYAKENKIIFNAGTGSDETSFKIRGFSSPDIEVFAHERGKVFSLTNIKVSGETEDDYSVIFKGLDSKNTRYLVFADSAVIEPYIYPDRASNLRGRNNQADYLVIFPRDFKEVLQPLIEHRRAQGLNVKLVDAEDIYDEFNSGIFSPEAIKDFLKYAYQKWRSPRPVFVLLAGDGTFDYRDFWQSGEKNLVPVFLTDTPDFGETVSDNWFVDFNNDIMPEMFIGRLPVKNNTQLGSVIEKILSYENINHTVDWSKKLLFAADIGAQFEIASDELAGIFSSSGYSAIKLYLSRSTPEIIRQSIINNINDGILMFNYSGHAGISLLSSSRIFQDSDIEYLNNNGSPIIFLAMDCATGYFIYPGGLDCLAEILLAADGKGSVACVAPSGLSSVLEQKIFGEGFYRPFFEEGEYVLGALHYRAKHNLYQKKSMIGSSNKVENVIQTFNLLGDPALLIRREGGDYNYPRSLIFHLQEMLKQDKRQK
ncbi:MAG: C25 family cysteine peptidase [bacterium]